TVLPTQYNSCRNAEVRLTFSEPMDDNSLRENLLVGFNNGSAECPEGSTAMPLAFAPDAESRGFWKRMWDGIAGFVQKYVIRPAFGNPPNPPSAAEQGERYCSVPGTITATLDGPAGSQHTVVTFSPNRAFPANKYIRIYLGPGAKSAVGAPIAATGYTAFFGTSGSICALEKVSVTPP